MHKELVQYGLYGLIILLIGIIYRSTNSRVNEAERICVGVSRKLDVKTDKETCEDHRQHQTKINIELIDRLARIETKMDLIINSRGIDLA